MLYRHKKENLIQIFKVTEVTKAPRGKALLNGKL